MDALPTLHLFTADDSPENAQGIDKLLRQQARELDKSWWALESIIAEAKTRGIHKHLGFKSWPDYIADVARREMPNVARSVEQRRQVVALLAGEGMSQRAIADAVGVSNATISRDQEVLHDVTPTAPTDLADSAPVTTPDTVTGRDGKQYPAKPKPKPDVPKPTELTDDQIAELHRIADAISEGRPWQEGLDTYEPPPDWWPPDWWQALGDRDRDNLAALAQASAAVEEAADKLVDNDFLGGAAYVEAEILQPVRDRLTDVIATLTKLVGQQ
jgi:hypothetical protein